MISGIHVHTTRDISKLSQISLAIIIITSAYNNFEISLMVCMPNIIFTNHAITYTNIMGDELHL